jgi:hypothetical protein
MLKMLKPGAWAARPGRSMMQIRKMGRRSH